MKAIPVAAMTGDPVDVLIAIKFALRRALVTIEDIKTTDGAVAIEKAGVETALEGEIMRVERARNIIDPPPSAEGFWP